MFLSGDSSITPRHIVDGGWHLLIRCGNPDCRRSTGPALRMPPWPSLYDTPLVAIYPKLRCSNLIERRGRLVKCWARTVELVVSKFTGTGSQMVEVLKLSERMG